MIPREVVSLTEKPEWTLVLADGVEDTSVTPTNPVLAKAVEQFVVVPAAAVPSNALLNNPPTDVVPVARTAPKSPVHDAPAPLYAVKVTVPAVLLVLVMMTCRLEVLDNGTYCRLIVLPFCVQLPADRVPEL